MSFQFAFDSAHGILRCQFSGELSDQSLREYHVAAKKQGKRMNMHVGLLEFKNITSVEVSTMGIAGVAQTPPARSGAAKLRVIIAPTDLIYGKCRAFEIMDQGSRSNIRIVRSLDEAYALLGITDPVFEHVPDAD